MPAIIKFIIVLDPAAPCYALSFDVSPSDIFRNTAATRAVATPDRTKALQFDTFEKAREVSKDITGWGGAQRVEPILVEFKAESAPDLGLLCTGQGRIEARDAATAYWHEHAERVEGGDFTTSAERSAMARLHFVRASLALDFDAQVTADERIVITDEHGNTLTLEWDGRIDGFDYSTSGDDACDLAEEKAQHEDEPICAGCDGLFPLREGQEECETCAAARSIVNPVTAALVAATEELSDWIDMADAEAKAERQPVMPILDEDAVTDLLTNLRHAAAADGIDFDELIAISARHFVAEVKVRADIARKRAEQANG
jgi:hypothetical protein